MRVGLAQINSTLGDFAGNREKIVEFTRRALEKRCDLVVFPELALIGYPPNDLLERSSVVDAQMKEFEKLSRQIPAGIAVVVGLITRSKRKKGKPYHNSAAFLVKGKAPKFFHKELLPTYDVFDEARHVEKGQLASGFLKFKNKRLLVTICEDIWGWELPDHPTNYLENPLVLLKKEKVDLVLNLSASPYTHQKSKDRLAVVTKTAKNFRAPLVYVNTIGAQDEIIFDGGSFAVDAKGKVLAQNVFFEEDLNVVDFSTGVGGFRDVPSDRVEKTRRALVVGLRDFARKTGLQRMHLGLSGGIDSAVVACLAVDALGPNRVTGVTLPGPYNESKSKSLGESLAKNLGIRCFNMPISPAYETTLSTLKTSTGDFEFGLVNENMQARLRGLFLMALGNKDGSLLLTTGNKSEYATGYSTLYGDMCGGLAPIGDLLKGEVYDLARLYNAEREIIPEDIITRAPSAELRPNQKDQDSLPPYDVLDAAVKKLVENQKPARSETEKWLLGALVRSEFKRWQAPPVLKVTGHAFGRGRRFPIAHKATI
jgi:NAD+ synthase (glutamine-hydrolysing)